MAFNVITIGSKIFNTIGQGVYSLSTVGFGQPVDQFKISAGKRNATSKVTTATMSRHVEKVVTTGSISETRKCSVVLQVQVPDGFTTAEVDSYIADISDFATPDNLTRVLLGDS